MPRPEVIRHAKSLPNDGTKLCGVKWGSQAYQPSEVTCRRCLAIIAKRQKKEERS